MVLKEKLRNGNQQTVSVGYADHTYKMLVFHKLDIFVKIILSFLIFMLFNFYAYIIFARIIVI